ncbi:small multi-drug export protein [Natrarchaeobius halalkaliphilus]|uniref:Small multi-drug export protein n=1 Tax=Natrarchaeobius halalkaliphilus TaxID=1679091 RepID=A0A3N6M904_9EURY|nr:small multi-drug export protein [Natrarchaeobius halalkaliphilus]RQG92740.1 small multi-drug export protein [Natrarchaeobius halalkaliphilus]
MIDGPSSALSGALFSTPSLQFASVDILFAGAEERARELLSESDGIGQYLLVFLLAATPLLEILIVIPIGVALGLNPILVASVAFAGNVMPVYVLLVASDRVRSMLAARRSDSPPSKRRRRAKRVWDSYGLPGLALSAPIVTGVHVGALIAVGLGATRQSAIVWMTASIALWTVVITVLSVTGATFLSGLL